MSAIFGGTKKTGGRFLIICLEERNIIAMKEGKPFLSPADKNGEIDLVIVYGTTLSDAIRELRKHGMYVPEGLENKADAVSGVSSAPKAVQ